MRTVNVGIIGMGGRGRFFYRYYSKQGFEGFDVKAVCDLDDERLDAARKLFGDSFSCYDDMHAMLGRDDIDLIIVATHDRDHVEPTIAALRAGKHVLAEKPLCQSVDDAVKIIREVRRAKGLFFMGFELREVTLFRQMKEFIDAGKIGEVKVAHVFDHVGHDFNAPFFRNPRRQTEYYRSLLLQKASHSLDLLNWFVGGRPVRVYGVGGLDVFGSRNDTEGGGKEGLTCDQCEKGGSCPYYSGGAVHKTDYGEKLKRKRQAYCVWNEFADLNDNAELCITYSNGVKATFHENYFAPEYTREFWLVGTKGKMYGYYDNPGRFLIRITNLMPADQREDSLRDIEEYWPRAKPGGHGGGDTSLRDEVYRRIIAEEQPPDILESAYYSTALAACAEDSIESGKPVDIPQLDD